MGTAGPIRGNFRPETGAMLEAIGSRGGAVDEPLDNPAEL
jgi:hypothetical protein